MKNAKSSQLGGWGFPLIASPLSASVSRSATYWMDLGIPQQGSAVFAHSLQVVYFVWGRNWIVS